MLAVHVDGKECALKAATTIFAIACAAVLVYAEENPAVLEREGKERLEADLAAAREAGKPQWLADVPLEIEITEDYQQMRRECDQRIEQGRYREALRMIYALLESRDGKIRTWAADRLPQALVAAKEFAFAMVEFEKRPTTSYSLLVMGRCRLHYCQFRDAAAAFKKAADLSEASTQKNVTAAQSYWGLGDVFRRTGDHARAKAAYQEACNLYKLESELSRKPAWYLITMKTYMQQMELMIDVCGAASVDFSRLKPGTHRGEARGYSGPVAVDVTITNGKIEKVEVAAQRESRPYESLQEVPAMIVERQSVSVDAVTGATMTSVGVMAAALRALEQAR